MRTGFGGRNRSSVTATGRAGHASGALVGAGLVTIALILGFTPYPRTYRTFLIASTGVAVLWLSWLFSGSF